MLSIVTIVGVAALAVVLVRRLGAVERRLPEIRRLGREVELLRAEVERGLGVTRSHLARVVAGDAPSADVVRVGRAFEDVQPAPALVLYEQDPELVVLDVRTEAEFASGHIPGARLLPVDELEDRLYELPPRETRVLVTCAAGGRSLQACQVLADHGWTNLLNLAGGMHGWMGPREEAAPAAPPAGVKEGTTVHHRGGDISEAQVIGALRECFDPEIPLNVYDLGLIYDVAIDAGSIDVTMTLTSEACPSARAIPDDVRRRLETLGQPTVNVEVVFDPPWHPARISPDGKQKLGLA